MATQQPLVIERTYNAPVGVIWKALTDKDEMKKWYFDLADFQPVKGFEFRFYGEGKEGQKYLHLCKITEAEPNRKLAYSWEYEGIAGSSLLTFELFDENGKTKLKLTHAGLDSFKTDSPDFSVESFTGGWTYILGTSLQQYVENSAQ